MIICGKCGVDNQLGRVFCTSCGAKLDLTNMSSQSITNTNKESWMKAHGKKLGWIPVILLIALAGFVMWPCQGVIGEKGTPAGSKKVEGQLAFAASLKAGQKGGPIVLTEQDINGYIENVMQKKANVSSMSVSLKKGLVSVRMVREFVKLGPVPIALSCDAKCLPSGGQLQIAKASLGHVPLVGPLVKIAQRLLGGACASDPQLAGLASLEDLNVEDGKVSFIVVKK